MSVAEFILIRHGETAENLSGIVQGQRDTRLNETGLRQAECAARRLRDEHFDAAYSSDLSRAMVTALTIARPLELAVEPCPELREWDLGDLSGLHRDEAEVRYPEVMDAFRFDQGEVIVPGGETRSEFRRRVAGFLDRLADRHAGEKVLLVTHAGTMRAAFHHIVGNLAPGVMLPQTGNASYSRFARRDGHWQLMVWNDTSHLTPVGFRDSTTF